MTALEHLRAARDKMVRLVNPVSSEPCWEAVTGARNDIGAAISILKAETGEKGQAMANEDNSPSEHIVRAQAAFSYWIGETDVRGRDIERRLTAMEEVGNDVSVLVSQHRDGPHVEATNVIVKRLTKAEEDVANRTGSAHRRINEMNEQLVARIKVLEGKVARNHNWGDRLTAITDRLSALEHPTANDPPAEVEQDGEKACECRWLPDGTYWKQPGGLLAMRRCSLRCGTIQQMFFDEATALGVVRRWQFGTDRS